MIYCLEDDESIRELVTYTLNTQGLEAQGFSKPSEFWEAMQKSIPDLVLLDIMLPEEDGFSILKKIRTSSMTKRIPVIMLTAKGSEYDTVRGLDSGADDYIPKPFRMMELLSRIRATLRRAGDEEAAIEEYQIENLYVCPSRHIVTVDGNNITLTLKEFELLCLLLAERGTVLTRSQLLDRIWGYEFDGESRTIDVHIRTLRQKLGEAGSLIKTVRGIGYKIEDADK
ncbi:response regulator transcription factor [Massilioclostridium coli]|uniref:response regulator transcription factor n=1 Tax=Massilioclostridium coli TaxID=1870991 RepID=UPI0022E6458F|nr:response regulator transcription factor [Massilioclostridium coli]